MRTLNSLAMFFAAATLSAGCFAADPPAPANRYAKAIEEAQQIPPDVAVQKARELRAKSDEGDAEATYQFALLLTVFGRFGPLADSVHLKEWNELSDHRSANQWILKAAELGDPDATVLACRLAEDMLAPAYTQDAAKAACKAGLAKQPSPQKGE